MPLTLYEAATSDLLCCFVMLRKPVPICFLPFRLSVSPWTVAASSCRALSAHAQDNSPHPVEIKHRQSANQLDVEFSDGKLFTFGAEFLRVKSPSADNERKDAKGLTRVITGRRHVRIMGLEPVGSYAIRIKFDDLHAAGIYTWPYLYDLGVHKLQYSRQYIRALRDRGLSREPPRTSSTSSVKMHSSKFGGTEGVGSGCSSHGCSDSSHGHDR